MHALLGHERSQLKNRFDKDGAQSDDDALGFGGLPRFPIKVHSTYSRNITYERDPGEGARF